MSHFGSRCCPKYVSAKPLTIFNLPMPALDDLACADLPGAIDPGFVDLEVRLLRKNSAPGSPFALRSSETMLDVGNSLGPRRYKK